MAKKQRKKSKNRSAQSAAALRRNGLRAFQEGDYQSAISTWERISAPYKPIPALAEAYFRQGLNCFYGSDDQTAAELADLQKANQLQPENLCYAYHLGLAHHHLGDLEQAIQAYLSVRRTTGDFSQRAAYPLALALLQRGEEPTSNPVWAELSAKEQAMLQEAGAFRRRPYQLSSQAPQFWHALAALDAGDFAQAQAHSQAAAKSISKTEQGIQHYYQGVIAAQTEDWETARREWLAAYSAGMRAPRLQNNLSETFHRLAENLLSTGDHQTALAAAQESKRHNADNNAINQLLSNIYQHLGFEAASAGRWKEAQSHWKNAVELDSVSFRLAYNLALSYERDKAYLLAGQTWREALRRRPRLADHPDAISDEQIARLWQRAAEAYEKAGDFDESSRVYQQAIKWSPENLDLRLTLADSLLLEGRTQAAQNELDRILEQNPDHVPTLIRKGEVIFRNEYWWRKAGAPHYWERALELQPNNLQARQSMAEWYLDQAEIDYSWDRFTKAVENYQKALEYQPREAITLASIANCFIHLNELDEAKEYTNQAFERANGNLDILYEILRGWVSTDNPEQAWKTMLQFETLGTSIPGLFYVVSALNWLAEDNKEAALPWIERGVQKAGPDEPIFFMIGEKMLDYDDDLARLYLEQAISAGQMLGQAHLMLFRLEDGLGNAKAGRKHFLEAERIARKTKDSDLAEKIELARMMSGGPAAFLERLMNMGGPEMVQDFLDDFSSEFGADSFYDF